MGITTLVLLATGGAVIGFLLSVLGAGGSILLLPLLVSGAALPTREAVPLSLLVVMLLALVAQGHWPAASLPLMLPLLLGGALGAVLGQRLGPHLSDRRLRQGFAALLVGTALLTGAEAVKRHQVLPDPAIGSQSRLGREGFNAGRTTCRTGGTPAC